MPDPAGLRAGEGGVGGRGRSASPAGCVLLAGVSVMASPQRGNAVYVSLLVGGS